MCKRVVALVIIFFCWPALAIFNRSLFFRTSSFWDEPRFEKPYLGTMDVQLAGGESHRGVNRCHKKTNILGLYGPENICSLSKAGCTQIPLPDNPAILCFQGLADVFEADFNFYQNFSYGFFTHFHLPVLLVQIYPSGYLANVCCGTDASYKPVWQNSFKPLEPFLNEYHQYLNPIHESGLSDSTLFLGWTKTYLDTCYLDYMDFTLKTGVLFPTGKKKNLDLVFDIPFGYNGFWAVPLSGDVAIGCFDWLSVGVHADSLFFFDKNQCINMKAPHQTSSGLVRLARGNARVHHGTVWRVGTYIKADHFFNGLSLTLAFSYEQKNRSKVRPCDKVFDYAFINDDERFKKWDRSIIHFIAEYDFSTEGSPLGPHIGVFFDRQLEGRRVFHMQMTGGYIGFDVAWCY